MPWREARRSLLLPRAFCIQRGFLFGWFSLADGADCSVVNQQFALARWALSTRRGNDRVHRRVDDARFAERQVKGWSKRSSFTGRTAKSYQNGFRCPSAHESEITACFTDGDKTRKC